MLAHTLVLPLLLAQAVHGAAVHVLPPLELEPGGPPVALARAEIPPLAAAALGAGSARPRTGAAFGGALAGTAVSDLVFAGMVAVAIAGSFDGFLEDDPHGGWEVLAVTGAAGFTFFTPAAAVWWAQHASGSEGRFWPAYLAAFGVRLVGAALLAAFPPAFLVTEFVVMPYVVARIVAGGRSQAERAAPPEPAPPADPDGLQGARAICPDAALVWR